VQGLDEARTALTGLRPRLASLIAVRADLAELRADLVRDGTSPLGGRPEAKGLEARLFADLEAIAEQGVQVKGYAPVLLDFPGQLGAEPVLWCWLEGDQELDWYHRLDCGFAGRRPIPPR
jgi:hypothetical protein